MINRRKEEIKKKGFSIQTLDTDRYMDPLNTDFNKIRVGTKTLEDAIYQLGDYKKVDKRLADKKNVLEAINSCNYETMREISNFFYKTSGIYQRLCRYMAYMYRYD